MISCCLEASWEIELAFQRWIVMQYHPTRCWGYTPVRCWGVMDPCYTHTRSAQWERREGAGDYKYLPGFHQPRTRLLQGDLGQNPCGESTRIQWNHFRMDTGIFFSEGAPDLSPHRKRRSAAGVWSIWCPSWDTCHWPSQCTKPSGWLFIPREVGLGRFAPSSMFWNL